jgi:hypothetical protein
MSAYLQLKGKLGELKRKQFELVHAGRSHIKSLKDRLATANLDPIESLDVQSVLYHAGELSRIQEEYVQVTRQVQEIKEELGEQ